MKKKDLKVGADYALVDNANDLFDTRTRVIRVTVIDLNEWFKRESRGWTREEPQTFPLQDGSSVTSERFRRAASYDSGPGKRVLVRAFTSREAQGAAWSVPRQGDVLAVLPRTLAMPWVEYTEQKAQIDTARERSKQKRKDRDAQIAADIAHVSAVLGFKVDSSSDGYRASMRLPDLMVLVAEIEARRADDNQS